MLCLENMAESGKRNVFEIRFPLLTFLYEKRFDVVGVLLFNIMYISIILNIPNKKTITILKTQQAVGSIPAHFGNESKRGAKEGNISDLIGTACLNKKTKFQS